MDRADKIFIGTMVVIIGFFIFGFVGLANHDINQKAACEAAGGYYIIGQALRECVDRKIIIKVQ